MIAFVKYESGKLTLWVIILHSIFDYEPLKTLRIYEGILGIWCSKHVNMLQTKMIFLLG